MTNLLSWPIAFGLSVWLPGGGQLVRPTARNERLKGFYGQRALFHQVLYLFGLQNVSSANLIRSHFILRYFSDVHVASKKVPNAHACFSVMVDSGIFLAFEIFKVEFTSWSSPMNHKRTSYETVHYLSDNLQQSVI